VRATADEVVAIDLSLAACVATERFGSALLRETADQLRGFFDHGRFEFSLPLRLIGTPHQKAVWAELQTIGAGSTRTYGDLAKALNSGPRAVASACRANAFPLVIPCHRVVAAKGLGGYCGAADGPWLGVKRWLLRHESA
jgi:methylated-DNA-[protein]-cysteine S-methyltransferase